MSENIRNVNGNAVPSSVLPSEDGSKIADPSSVLPSEHGSKIKIQVTSSANVVEDHVENDLKEEEDGSETERETDTQDEDLGSTTSREDPFKVRECDKSESIKNMITRQISSVADLEEPPQLPARSSLYIDAVDELKKERSARTVMKHLNNVWTLYEDTMQTLENQNKVLLRTRKLAEKLELEAKKSPRVVEAIYYAAKSRMDLKELEQINDDREEDLRANEREISELQSKLRSQTRELDLLKEATIERDNWKEAYENIKSEMEEHYRAHIELLEDRLKETYETSMRKSSIHQKEYQSDQVDTTEGWRRSVKIDKTLTTIRSPVRSAPRLEGKIMEKHENSKKVNEQYYKNLAIEYRDRITHLEAENRHLTRKSIKEKNATPAGSQGKSRQGEICQGQLRVAKADIAQMQQTIQDRDKELVQIKTDLANTRASLKVSLDENQKKEDHAKTMVGMLTTIQQDRDGDRKNINTLQNHINKGVDEIHGLVSKCEAMAKILEMKKAEIITHQADKKVLSLSELAAQNLNKHMVQEVSNQKSFIARQEKIIGFMRKLLLDCRAKAKLCEYDTKRLNQFVAYLESKMDELLDLMSISERAEIRCSKKNAMITMEIGIIQDLLNDSRDSVARQEVEIQGRMKTEDQMDIIIESKERKIKKLTEDLLTKIMHCNQLESDLREKGHELSLVRDELNAANKKIKELTTHLNKVIIDLRDMTRLRNSEKSKAAMLQAEKDILQERMGESERALKTGNIVLRNRHNDVRALVVEVKFLRNKLRAHDAIMVDYGKLKQEHIKLSREAIRTEVKLKALETMKPFLKCPMRDVKALNVTAYELHLKSYHLTKRLIRKTMEVTEKEEIIIQKNRLFLELKTMVMRRGDPRENLEELLEAKRTLQNKTKQIKSLKADLSTCQVELSSAREKAKTCQDKLDESRKEVIHHKLVANRKKQDKSCVRLPPLKEASRVDKSNKNQLTISSFGIGRA